MPFLPDTRSSLRRAGRLDDLVAAIYQAGDSSQEAHWLEWKSSLDLDSAHGKFTAAKAIIAFANREPAAAARDCDGEGYFVVGVSSSGVIGGVNVIDAAVLHAKLRTFVDGPHFDVDYVDTQGTHVLVITVAPPQPGDRIHSLVKDYESYRSGTVFVRGLASSDPATHRELNALQDRLLGSPAPSAIDEFITALGSSNPGIVGRLMRRATAEVITECRDADRFPPTFASRVADERIRQYVEIADRYRSVAAPLIERVIEGCRVQNTAHERLWRDTVTALAEPRPVRADRASLITIGRDDDLEALALLPATLTMYAGVIAATDSDNYGAVRALSTDGAVSVSLFEPDRKVNLIDKVGPWEVCSRRVELALALRAAQQNKLTDDVVAALARGGQPHRATYPVSAYLCEALQPYFADHTATRYNELFDTAEILFALIVADQLSRRAVYIEGPWLGLFVTHAARASLADSHFGRYIAAITEVDESWKPLQAGMFGGSVQRLKAAAQAVWKFTEEQYRRGPF
ncbi:MAG: hypothetical protein QOJ56_5281 [Mycobacterium sp.]|nr:hypothetical protein [Mycobacterium sp.]